MLGNLHGVATEVRESNISLFADEPFLELFDEFHASYRIVEEPVASLHIFNPHILRFSLLADQGGRRNYVAGIPKPRFLANLGQERQRIRGQLNLFLLCSNGQDLLNFVPGVVLCADDNDPVKEVER